MRSIVQKPRAKRVGLGLKYKQHLLEYNSGLETAKESIKRRTFKMNDINLSYKKLNHEYHIVFVEKSFMNIKY